MERQTDGQVDRWETDRPGQRRVPTIVFTRETETMADRDRNTDKETDTEMGRERDRLSHDCCV